MSKRVKTPVLAHDANVQHVLGYLEHEDVSDSYLAVRLTPEPRKWPRLQDWPPHDVRHNRRDEARFLPTVETVQLRFGLIGVSRPNGDTYHCRILITEATPEMLCRLPGFKWFAEEHGYRFQQAKVAGAPV